MKRFIVILDGPMGSGKSTTGELVAEKLKRTALINQDKIKWFLSDYRRSIKDNNIVRSVFYAMVDAYLKQGINLVISQGITKTTSKVDRFTALAKKYNFKLFIYHLDAPKAVLVKRVRIASRKKLFKNFKPIAPTRIDRNIRIWKNHRYHIGKDFQTDKLSSTAIANQIFKDLKKAK